MIGIVLSVGFAGFVGLASVFSRRGLETESFDIMLVTSLLVSSPLFILLALLTTGFENVPLQGVAYALAGGVVGSVVGRSLYLLGIEYVGPGKSLSVNATSPLYAAVLAVVILSEEITSATVVGTAVIVLGVVAISQDTKTEAERAGRTRAVILLPLFSAVLLAVAITLRKLALNTGLAPIETGAVNMTIGLLVTVPPVYARHGRGLGNVDRAAMRNFLYASVLMAVGFVCYFQGLHYLPANVFYPLIQTQPLFAVLFSVLLIEDLEIVTRRTAVGTVGVVAGAVLVVLG